MADAEMRMRMSDWRGYSAYEVAVQNGFSGTQAEWLASLAQTATVNHQVAVNGDITVTGANIARSGSNTQTVDDTLTDLENDLSELDGEVVAITNEEIDTALAD